MSGERIANLEKISVCPALENSNSIDASNSKDASKIRYPTKVGLPAKSLSRTVKNIGGNSSRANRREM